MALTPGTRLGPYEITARIGVGGMGEVYQATDTNLKRQVAIKVLPDAVAQDAERLARFQREAEVLASLNHPGIAAIYGLERTDGQTALVMELVEGPTLADRIAKGPIPVDEALPIAKQIAEALEAAHEQGIIHRDLKPANIKLRPDGTVKVLDFGLAKAMEPAAGASSSASMSPTITTPAMTQAGLILGTAAYMSPEQARGKPLDKRADLWAFGCVLYEMLTGKRAFGDRDVPDVLAAVLTREPDWSRLPSSVPESLRACLHRCLQKDSRQRLADAQDLRLVLGGVFDPPVAVATSRARKDGRRSVVLVAALAVVVGTLLGGWAASRWRGSSTPDNELVSRLALTLPPGEALAQGAEADIAVTPDGAQIAYMAADEDGVSAIYLRSLAAYGARRVEGSERAFGPFFSPDGAWLGFFSAGVLMKVSVSGSSPVSIAETSANQATWAPDDTIILASVGLGEGLLRVSADGGVPEPLTTVDSARGERSHESPHVLPDGSGVLFSVVTDTDTRIALLDFRSGERALIPGLNAQEAVYLPTGHLLSLQNGNVVGAVLDRESATLTTVPVSLLGGVAALAVSQSGLLLYRQDVASNRELVWVDRAGTVTPTGYGEAEFNEPRISHGGDRFAVEIGTEAWVYDVTSGARSRLEPGGLSDGLVWSSDDRSIAMGLFRAGSRDVYQMPVDGGAPAEPLATSEDRLRPLSWSSETVSFYETNPTTKRDLWTVRVGGNPMPLLVTPDNESTPMIAPSGDRLAYLSDSSGRTEVIVSEFPSLLNTVVVSQGGGTEPVWSRDGRELFYRQGSDLMVVGLDEATQAPAPPRRLFSGRFLFDINGNPNYDVTPDGERFLMVRAAADNPAVSELNVIQNWFTELERLVPTD